MSFLSSPWVPMEAESKSNFNGRKRMRAIGLPNPRTNSALSNRISRLAKKLKTNNPTHLFQVALGTAFNSISTTGDIYEIGSGIAQGDDYNNRFGTKILITHVNVKGILTPAGASTIPAVVRVTIIRLPSGAAFAANMQGSYSPIVTGTSLQVYYDKYYTVCGGTTVGYGTSVNVSKKLKWYQKYSTNAAFSTTGESLFLIIQSNLAATLPLLTGVLEIFFQPM